MKGHRTLDAVSRLVAGEDGADSTEYALLAALIALAVISGAAFLGDKLNAALTNVGNVLPTIG